MAFALRAYQQEAVDAAWGHVCRSFGTDDHGLIVMPTGSGKSIVIAELVRLIHEQDPRARILGLTHVKELVEQNASKIEGAGVYSAGLGRREMHEPFVMAGIQSVFRRASAFGHVHVLLIDEAHLISRNDQSMYRTTIDALREINPDLVILGLTATPFRADGTGYLHTGEGALFKSIVYDVPMQRLVTEGWLVKLVTKRTIASYDMSGVATRGGDYAKGELETAISLQEDVTVDAVAEGIKRAKGCKKWLVFAVSVAHAEHCASLLRAAGITAACVTGETKERDEIIELFREGRITALVNVYVLTTGFDVPDVDCLIVLRPTKSAVLWVQMCGRGMRTAPGKDDCLVLDFGENAMRLGPVNDPIVKEAGGKEGMAPVKVCDQCESIVPAGVRECPDCGFIFPPPQSKLVRFTATTPVYREDDPEEWNVQAVTYSEHNKAGKPPSMRVSYHTSLMSSFSEWICFEHGGFATQKAHKWWVERRGDRPVPETTAEALERTDELREPLKILVRHEKAKDSDRRYARVLRCTEWYVPNEEPPF